MNIADVGKIDFRTPAGWNVAYHELYDIQPCDADSIEGFTDDFPIWHSHFGQDLLQIINVQSGILLDVGWGPSFDPSGQFRLCLIKVQNDQFDWTAPLLTFETRDLLALRAKIDALMIEHS
jgi:hypothetical protein